MCSCDAGLLACRAHVSPAGPGGEETGQKKKRGLSIIIVGPLLTLFFLLLEWSLCVCPLLPLPLKPCQRWVDMLLAWRSARGRERDTRWKLRRYGRYLSRYIPRRANSAQRGKRWRWRWAGDSQPALLVRPSWCLACSVWPWGACPLPPWRDGVELVAVYRVTLSLSFLFLYFSVRLPRYRAAKA